MDANTTCGLVTTVGFASYNNIVVGTTQNLVEFNMSSNHVNGNFSSVVSTNDFTSFITTPTNFIGAKPRLTNKQSIVTGYLGYGSATYTDDFYIVDGGSTRPFRDLSPVASNIISSGDLCASNDIYSSTVYSGSNSIPGLSLTSNLDPNIVTSIQNQIDLLQNKNKMFYSFFVYEYCYYNTMYNTLLTQFFDEYSSPTPSSRLANIANLKDSSGNVCSTTGSAAEQAKRLDALLIVLARVNSRLTDMRNLLSALQNYYSVSLQTMQRTLNSSGILGSDSDAQAKVTALKNQSAGVEQAKDDSSFRKGIMEYTSEKNRYSNILLGIYAFLNLAIIGVIFAIKE